MTNMNEIIEEGVIASVKLKAAKEQLDSVAEVMSDEFDMDKVTANQIIAKAYQRQYEEEKYQKQKDRIEQVYKAVEGV